MNKISRVAVVLCVMGIFIHNGLTKIGSINDSAKAVQAQMGNSVVPLWVITALIVVALAVEILAPIGVIVANVAEGSWTKGLNNTSLWFLIVLSLIISVSLLPSSLSKNSNNSTMFANTAFLGGCVLLLKK